jgi:hypothetical protein
VNSEQIQETVYQWAVNHNFAAPYGVLTGEHTNAKGSKYRSVTFGYARTLDATIEIYNRNFIVVRTSNSVTEVVKSFDDLMKLLKSRWG